MTWATGNGKDISFQNDKWIALEDTLGEVASPLITREEKDNKVIYYIQQDGEWNWTTIKQTPRQELTSLCGGNALLHRGLSLTPNGRFTAASAHKMRDIGTRDKPDKKLSVVQAWKWPTQVQAFLQLWHKMPR